jgi:hypothetical protein
MTNLFKKKLSARDVAQGLVLFIRESLEERIRANDDVLAEAITRLGEQRTGFEWITFYFFVVDLTVWDHFSDDRELGKAVRDHLMTEFLEAYPHVITSTSEFLEQLEDYQAAWNRTPNEFQDRLQSIARSFARRIAEPDLLVTLKASSFAVGLFKGVRGFLGKYRIVNDQKVGGGPGLTKFMSKYWIGSPSHIARRMAKAYRGVKEHEPSWDEPQVLRVVMSGSAVQEVLHRLASDIMPKETSRSIQDSLADCCPDLFSLVLFAVVIEHQHLLNPSMPDDVINAVTSTIVETLDQTAPRWEGHEKHRYPDPVLYKLMISRYAAVIEQIDNFDPLSRYHAR